jgi:dihydrofolate reductase
MIRCIAALDSKLGMATDQGIPWHLPTDIKHFRDTTRPGGDILMGYGTYVEFKAPLHERTNYVASSKPDNLRPGFEVVSDAVEFLQQTKNDVWVIGGPGLFAQTIQLAQELHLTRIDHDFNCTKFFPEFETDFERVSATAPQTENDLTFHFEVWRRLS